MPEGVGYGNGRGKKVGRSTGVRRKRASRDKGGYTAEQKAARKATKGGMDPDQRAARRAQKQAETLSSQNRRTGVSQITAPKTEPKPSKFKPYPL